MGTNQINQIKQFECPRCKRIRIFYAKGLCKNCYCYSKMNKETHKQFVNKWKEKNPNYFKDYYRMRQQLKMEKENE